MTASILQNDPEKASRSESAPLPANLHSRTLHITTSATSPPPDGGLLAWTQVLAGHLVVFNTWGYINSFGIFQAYYSTSLSRSPSEISWVVSIQILLVFLIGAFSGRAPDAGYHRAVIVAGAVLQVVGIFMTSLSTTYWQLFLAQGICQGLGDGLLFCPTVALISTYFLKKRSLAISSVACGGATGGMIFPAIARQLLPTIGFAWTVRVMGFVILTNFAVVLALTRTRIPPRKTGPIIEWAAFREMPYVLFTVGSFLAYLGLHFAYFYVCSQKSLLSSVRLNHFRSTPLVAISSTSPRRHPYLSSWS